MKILVVEDEVKVAGFLKSGLEENNFEVMVAHDGLAGTRMALQQKFGLIILDLNLPLRNGYEVSRAVRAVNEKIPILMLTALGTTDDKILGFDAGADDYMVKPFEFRELLARVKAILHRSGNQQSNRKILKV